MFRIGQMYFDRKFRVDINLGMNVCFFIGNEEDIPYGLKASVRAGDRISGLFEFDPQDQFADFIDLEKVKIVKITT